MNWPAWLAAWVAGTAWQLMGEAPPAAAGRPLAAALALLAAALLTALALALHCVSRRLAGAFDAAGSPGSAGSPRIPPRLSSRVLPAAALLAALLSGALAGWGVAAWRTQARLAQSLPAAAQGAPVMLQGVIAAMPQRTASGWRFLFDVQPPSDAPNKSDADAAPALPPRLLLSWFVPPGARGPNLRAGQRWQWAARLRPPHGPANPHGFDVELWLWQLGVRASGAVQPASARLLGESGAHPIERLRQRLRDGALAQIAGPVGGETGQGTGQNTGQRAPAAAATDSDSDEGDPAGLPRRLAGIVAALAVGDQNAIAQADWDVFRATGVAHLMSISGLHVTLFAWLAAAFMGRVWLLLVRLPWPLPGLRALRLRLSQPALALGGGVALAALYALLSGWGVPAQRTVLMLAVFAAVRLGGLRWPWPLTWLAACAAVLALDPWAWLQAGFWLSFIAVGLLFAAGDAQGPRPAAVADSSAGAASAKAACGRLAAWLAALLGEQARITVALAPLSLLLFGQTSLLALLANAVAIPWVTFVVTPLALGGMLCPPLWQAAAWAVSPLLAFLQALADWPWASISLPAAPWWAGAAAIAGAACLGMRWPLAWRLAGLPLLLPLLLWQPARPPAGHFELLAADVGQGGGALIRTAHHTLLYDSGPRYSAESDAGQRVLTPLMQALGAVPEGIVISHADADHAGGARAVLTAAPRAWLLASFADPALPRPAMRCQAGQSWQWDGVRFAILHPLPADYARPGADDNALSCVLHIRAASGAAALLTGDIGAVQEIDLVQRLKPRPAGSEGNEGNEGKAEAAAAPVPALQADLLLMPHHGSRYSSSAALLDAVAPRHAIAQAGWRNRFHHPAPQALARYARRGIAVTRSAYCGAALWQSQRPQHIHCERHTRRRPWHTRPEREDRQLQKTAESAPETTRPARP